MHDIKTDPKNILRRNNFAENIQLTLLILLFWFIPGVNFSHSAEKSPKASQEKVVGIPEVMQEIQRGRETGEAHYFTRAEHWLTQMPVTKLNQDKILGLQAWIALFQHEFQEARSLAEQARHLRPRVPFYYGVISDAALELGDYEQALSATQKMLDLKPEQGALSRAAHLRDLHGDREGAIQLWKQAIQAGAPAPENTAWCEVELGDVYFKQGQIDLAQFYYLAALERHPNDHRAFAHLARVQAAQGQQKKAEQSYKQAIAILPRPPYIAALGDLYLDMDLPEAAETQFAQVALTAKLDTLTANSANRDLALFYANHNQQLDEALRIAKQALAERKDIITYEILAWVYYKSGRYSEAEHAITQALRLGTQDAEIWFHAGMIAQALGNKVAAQKYLTDALQQNPHFDLRQAHIAKQHLKQLTSTKGESS